MTSSLISFVRKEIHETIPGMMCADYCIPESVSNVPSILLVEDSHYYKPDIEGNNDMVMVPSAMIAESLVRMHNTSQLGYSNNSHPAFFAIPNVNVDAKQLMLNYQEQCAEAMRHQRVWYAALVRMADDDWQVLKRHNMVSSIQRIAARELGLNREWLLQIEEETGIPDCPFCGKDLINPASPVCPTCGRIINAAKYAEIEKLVGSIASKSVKV